MVDDHPVIRLAMTAQLAALGYATAAADGGRAALALLAEAPYDAVLLDCEMPHPDGYETCRLLREREDGGRRTRVIALTAHSAPGDRERCLAAGMDDHLGKPVRAGELAAVLSRWLDGGAGDEPPGPAALPAAALPAADADRLESRLAALERLGRLTGEELLGPVIENFLHRGAGDLDAMRRALPRGDGAALAAGAHSLAGSSGILGAAGLAASCAELEELARRGDLAACASRLDAVEQAFHSIARQLSA